MRYVEATVTDIDLEDEIEQTCESELSFVNKIRHQSPSKVMSADHSGNAPVIQGVVLGRIVRCDPSERGRVAVDYDGNPAGKPLSAISAATIGKLKSGAEVALIFQDGNPYKPIVVGPIQKLVEPKSKRSSDQASADARDRIRDNEKIELKANKEIVLRCGDASITLTKAGKVIIRGSYLLNRSSGVNRIKGGSVQIN